MQRVMTGRPAVLGFLLVLGLAVLWGLGLLDPVQGWITESQRAVQNRLAGAVRAIRAGEAGALFGLLLVAFLYGLFHAAGPGHGKMLIGGYGMARRVPLARLALLSLAASLAQAAVAVALVYGFIAVLGWTRDRVEGLAERVLDPMGLVAIGAIGLWLVWRGARGLWGRAGGQGHAPGHDHHHHHHQHDHDHHHHHEGACGCGHAHGPTLEQAEAVTGWRDAALLIGGIAVRPCSGALFLLILTWKMGIGGAGIAGTFAMGLGTALVTVGVATLAVWSREGVLASLPGASLARAVPVLELAVGAVVTVVAARMLMAAF
jgi:nickel/cobalt transporter (NicO) family protein